MNNIEKLKHFQKRFPRFRAIGFGEILAKRLGYKGVKFLKDMLTLDPGRRRSCKKALNHSYFENYEKMKKIILKTINQP